MKLLLPWPPKQLNPNARCHWSVRAAATKLYRRDCYLLAKVAGLVMPSERATLSLTFRPPDRRRRDDDNLIAACKALRDGLAQAMGIDDSRLSMAAPVIGPPMEGGGVEVEVSYVGG